MTRTLLVFRAVQLGRVGLLTAATLLQSGCGQQAEPAPVVAAAAQRRVSAPPPFLARPVEEVEAEPGNALPASTGQTKLPVYEIKMNPRDLASMDRMPYDSQTFPATFMADGVVYENVKIRYRGAWARTWPKKPLKIFFDSKKTFKGQECLNLNSSFRDPSFIRETLAYQIYNAAGSPGPTSQLVRVHLNGQFRGVYVEVEQPDKSFLKRNNLKGATLVKAVSRMKISDERELRAADEYRQHYEQQNQKKEDSFERLEKLCRDLAHSPNALEFFEKNIDIEKYVNYLAATTLCQNWDGYSKNHFLVYDGKGSKKWFVVPWDLDRALGDHWEWSFGRADLPIELGTRSSPAITGWNRLQDKFFSEPKLRQRLAARLEQLLETEFTTEKLAPVIDQLQQAVAADAKLDHQRWPSQQGNGMYRDNAEPLEESIARVKQFIEDRRKFVRGELTKLRS